MAARSIGSGIISFGLVTIPFKVYTAVSPQSVSFNLLHKNCGSRLTQQLVCKTENVVVERADCVSGYEHTRDQYVSFTKEELDAIKASRPGDLTLEEFVPADSVDLLYIERTYYLGPDKGGDVAYGVLAAAMKHADKIGVGRYVRQGKELLALIRPYQNGLIMHEAYYANEVRPWNEVDLPKNVTLGPEHVQMAQMLIAQLERPAFDPSRFRDEYAATVLEAVQKKIAGEELVTVPAPKAPVIDLLEALKRSVAANDAELEKLRRERPVKGPKKAAPRTKTSAKKKRGGE